jgi:hypothetical protein
MGPDLMNYRGRTWYPPVSVKKPIMAQVPPIKKSPMINPTKKYLIFVKRLIPPYLMHKALNIHPMKKLNHKIFMAELYTIK